jgi:hypothetical protein
MVKGLSRRVIVIKSPELHLFDEAIFIVREDALRDGGVTGEEIIKQAQEVADNYVRCQIKKRRISRLPAPLFALLGAGMTGLAWFLSVFVF